MTKYPNNSPPAPLSLTIAQASEVSGIPGQTLRDLIRREELACIRYGGGKHRRRYLLMPDDLLAWLQLHRIPSKHEVNKSPNVDSETTEACELGIKPFFREMIGVRDQRGQR